MNFEKIESMVLPVNLPLFLSGVPAGFPSPATDYIEEKINLNHILIKHPESTYLLRVEGHSMIDANIKDGDIIIVDSAITAKDGDIIIASLEGEFTVKKLQQYPLRLLPMNNAYSPISIEENNDFQIFGVVTYIIYQA